MNHPTRWKGRLALAIVAALVAAPASPAPAAAPAGDEYVLDLPGGGQTESTGVNTASGAGDREQRGVVGEADPPATPLAALGATAGSMPAPLLVGLTALLVLAIIAALGRRRATSRGTR